jgi:hypothetical protein
VNRQVVVLAYKFGDGLSNILIPTQAVIVGALAMAACRPQNKDRGLSGKRWPQSTLGEAIARHRPRRNVTRGT